MPMLTRHIDQHQADQDFIGIEAVAQPGRDTCPEHTAQDARQYDRQHDPAAAALLSHQCHATGGNRPQHILAFSANVPDVGAKTHGQPERDQQQRRGLDGEFTQRIGAFDRVPKKHPQSSDRVFTQRDKQQHANQHRNNQR